jgi:hypothetical protein
MKIIILIGLALLVTVLPAYAGHRPDHDHQEAPAKPDPRQCTVWHAE